MSHHDNFDKPLIIDYLYKRAAAFYVTNEAQLYRLVRCTN